MTANRTLLQKKYARIVDKYAEKYRVTMEEALGLLYKSRLYRFIRDGVSDLHCMSDEYLVEELHEEWQKKGRA